MAKETKFIEVDPNRVNSTIEMWQNFGWEIIGTPQEINYTTTHRTQETDKHYSSEYSTKTNYVKITFQRDKSMQHYDELVGLESIYYSSAPSKPCEPEKPSAFGCLWIILSGVGLVFCVLPGVAIIIWRLVRYNDVKKTYEEEYSKYKQNYENWDKAYKEWDMKCENALKQAKLLV